MAAYARQAKDTELVQYATEIKVRGRAVRASALAPRYGASIDHVMRG